MTRTLIRLMLSGVLVGITATATLAQSTTETKKFQVIAVDGNQLVVRLPEGTKELTVPDDFRFTVDGKSLSVHELRPGMAGTATITTTTTVIPVTVTEIKEGTVLQALGGSSIIVRTGDQIKMFSQSDIDKRGVKIMRHGKPAQISDFHTNDKLTATIVTTMPPKVLTEKEVQATLAKAAPAASQPAASRPAASQPAPAAPAAQGASSEAPRALPRTASNLPLLGLLGFASLVAGVSLTVRRRLAAR